MSEHTIDYIEFLSLSRALEKHHAIFNALWNTSKPIFSEELPTLGIYFDKIGEEIDFKINPNFWKSLSDKQKEFCISHEMLHVILYHGLRINELSNEEKKIANQVLDIVVNHSLVNRFGFNRQEVDPNNKLCWVDTVFPKNTPKDDEYFEYYYNLLEKQQSPNSGGSNQNLQGFGEGKGNSSGQNQSNSQNQSKGKGNKDKSNSSGQVLDEHSGLESFVCKDFENKVKELTSNMQMGDLPKFVQDQTQDLSQIGAEAGISPGTTFKQMKVEYIIPKKKWETIIKDWAKKAIKDKEEEQWSKKARRLAELAPNLLLPTDQEIDAFEKDRIEVYFFLDTSGSCEGYADRFFKAASSLPKEKFDIKLYCFDTRVYPTDLKSGKLYGFGGTAFQPIENYIQREIKDKEKKYPKAIFIITDGYGTNIYPEFPERYHWFMTSYSTTAYIPKESKIYQLKDFE